MKNLYFLLFSLLITSLSFGQDMLITGAFDGPLTGGTPKLAEIYVINDIPDLSLYGFGAANNGEGTDGEEVTFSGSASAGDFIYVAYEGSNPGAFMTYFGITPDYLDFAANVNGDDALELFFNGGVIDTFGDINVDGTGEPWEYMDGWAYRIDGSGPDGATFTLANWSFSGANAVDGCTTNAGCSSVFPAGTYSTTANPSLALSDAPPSGSTITLSEEGVNATIDFITTNFVMSNDSGGCNSDSSGDGYIVWDGEDTGTNMEVDSGCIFTSNDGFEYAITGLSVGNTYLLTAELVDNSGSSLVPAVTYTLTVIIAAYVEVANLAALRAGTVDDEIFYKVTGEVINTYSRASRNQKYFQDATGGILIDDDDFEISTAYNAGDGVTNIRGHLVLFNGLFELVPTEADWGVATSTGNDITPPVVTLASIIASLGTYESKLVRINSVTFADGNGAATFANAVNYDIDDGTASTFRTNFSEADYIGELIPTGSTSFAAIVGNFNGTPQVTARSLSDLTLSVGDKSLNVFAVFPNPTSLGFVNIISKNNETITANVFDVLGKQVMSREVTNNKLDVSSLNAGVYFMKLTQNNATITKKLVID